MASRARRSPQERLLAEGLASLGRERESLLWSLGYAGNVPDRTIELHRAIDELDARIRSLRLPSAPDRRSIERDVDRVVRGVSAGPVRSPRSPRASRVSRPGFEEDLVLPPFEILR